MNIALKSLRRSSARDVDALVEDLQSLSKDVTSLVTRLKDRHVAEAVSAVGDSVGTAASGVVSRIGDRLDPSATIERIGDHVSALYASLYKDAAKQGRRTMKVVNRQLHDRPGVGLLAAFCAGLLVTQFLSGRRD
jgi:hypothetical protein